MLGRFFAAIMLFGAGAVVPAFAQAVPPGTNYQPTATRDFPSYIAVPGLPTMWVHIAQKDANQIKDSASNALDWINELCHHKYGLSPKLANDEIDGSLNYLSQWLSAFNGYTDSASVSDANTIATLINIIKLRRNCPPPVPEHAMAPMPPSNATALAAAPPLVPPAARRNDRSRSPAHYVRRC